MITRRGLAAMGGLLTGAAAAKAAAEPAAAGSGVAPLAEAAPYGAADFARASISAPTSVVRTSGYYKGGDGGSADYVRVAAEPAHPGKLRDAGGGWWELRETVVNPVMFGAVMDGKTPCDAAFNAMSAYVEAVKTVTEIRLGANANPKAATTNDFGYLLRTGWVLPSYSFKGGVSPVLKITGYGAFIRTDATNIDLISRVPTAQSTGSPQDRAEVVIGYNRYVFEGVVMVGSGLAGQNGLVIGATYGMQLKNCRAIALGKGFVAAFCLQSHWEACETINCVRGGFYLQDGTDGGLGGISWTGATTSNSQSNVSVFESCRVYGHPMQEAAFYLYASDSCALRNCVAEGAGGAVDLRFDYGGSTTVKLFTIDGMHFENPNARLLMKIRTTGVVKIRGIFHQYPAAILDASGGVYPRFYFEDLPYVVGANGDPRNPKGYLFWHSDGGGYGGAPSGASNGAAYEFHNVNAGIMKVLKDPDRWEAGKLPYALRISSGGDLGGGVTDFVNSYVIDGPSEPGSGVSFNQNITYHKDNSYTLGSSRARPIQIFAGSRGISTAGDIYPAVNNTVSIGVGALRFSAVYAATGAINTSDARTKTAIAPLNEREAEAGFALLQEIGLYKFLSSVAEKGEEDARRHVGMTVQRAIEILREHDLDPFSYSFICHDRWEAQDAVWTEERIIHSAPGPGDDPAAFASEIIEIIPATLVTPAREAGDLYSFRKDDLILFMLAGLARRLGA